MSIRPFSPNEIEKLTELIEKNGWLPENLVKNSFLYSLKKNKLLIFTIKIPVRLPAKINSPFQIARFQVSVVFQLWNLNQYAYNIIIYLINALRSLGLSLKLEHDLPIKGKEQQLFNLIDVILPEQINNEDEDKWLNRIRVSLMNKREQFEVSTISWLDYLVKALIHLGLEPTFEQPWELKKGVPKIRTSETLFFSNEEPYDEFFILEKGYYTYFKDIEYNKFYLRSSFDTYAPYILNTLFKDISNFKSEDLIQYWIKSARMALNSMIEILTNEQINPNEFIQFRHEKELIDNIENFIFEKNNFAFSALRYESTIAKQVFQIHTYLFNTPPTNFEVIESINRYTEAEELIENYRFEEATNLLNESLIVFNRNQQKKIVVSVLLKLNKIASILNQEETALNYLQNALGVAKSGEVPIQYIIKIHHKLGKSYYKRKEFKIALNQYKTILNFLKAENISSHQEEFLAMAYIYSGLINIELNNLAESKNLFKQGLEIAKDLMKVKLKYYLLRAKQYKDKGSLSKAQKFLKVGINISEFNFNNGDHKNILIELMLEMAEFYIHYRKDSRKAIFLLRKVKDHLSFKEINEIRRAIRWNLLMSDYYNIMNIDHKNSQFYLKQSQKLKAQLKTIGVE